MLKVLSKEEYDKLSEALKEHYAESNGKYVPQVEGMVLESQLNEVKSKLAEFRDTNITVLKDRDKLKKQLEAFDGIDTEEYKALKAEKESLGKLGVNNSTDLPKVIESFVAKAVNPLKQELETAKAEREQAKHELQAKAVDTKITEAAIKAGILPDVLSDVVERAHKIFKYVDGEVVARNGELPIYGKDGSKPLSIEEWIGKPAETSLPKAFFQPSSGGGANGGAGDRGAGAKVLSNPDAKTFGANLEDIATGKTIVK